MDADPESLNNRSKIGSFAAVLFFSNRGKIGSLPNQSWFLFPWDQALRDRIVCLGRSIPWGYRTVARHALGLWG